MGVSSENERNRSLSLPLLPLSRRVPFPTVVVVVALSLPASPNSLQTISIDVYTLPSSFVLFFVPFPLSRSLPPFKNAPSLYTLLLPPLSPFALCFSPFSLSPTLLTFKRSKPLLPFLPPPTTTDVSIQQEQQDSLQPLQPLQLQPPLLSLTFHLFSSRRRPRISSTE